MNVSPHARHFVYSLPPEGALAAFGRPGGGSGVSSPAPHSVFSLPPRGARAALGRLGGGSGKD